MPTSPKFTTAQYALGFLQAVALLAMTGVSALLWGMNEKLASVDTKVTMGLEELNRRVSALERAIQEK